jgi:hypothetical protein
LNTKYAKRKKIVYDDTNRDFTTPPTGESILTNASNEEIPTIKITPDSRKFLQGNVNECLNEKNKKRVEFLIDTESIKNDKGITKRGGGGNANWAKNEHIA